ncbi:MAG: adenylosuccinate lyase family protein [bacterium]|nr:adenylosuccinate lyase family protein [bacterium]MCY3653097.1 adenylosuccinate lyase family protein [bacterium]MDE0643609.1 adenylosuccinate lyase family protein [bacterium]MYF26127.1 adenylosuccinate lyase family protein [Acidimicrobiia bacterium]MYH55304.1 adenylosuccinate lyase family protein [Acidimicrobiia bacterium]
MSVHLADSVVYGHLWSTEEARKLLDEEPRFRAWLEILSALAHAQAEVGLIPIEAARRITRYADSAPIDLERIAAETRATGHSTLGLIRVLRAELPESVREWVYYGATVQDVTDTWTASVMQKVGDYLERDLARLEAAALGLARRHRTTPMMGRTHAQPALPIPFGYKAAVWAAELGRHRQRLEQGRPRREVVQLGGALGTLEFWGDQSLALIDAFARRMNLRVPPIPWITARDGPAEFVHLLAMVSTTLAKIGNEIMELQRPEIAEVREPFIVGTVGSITMPQKRNPELSEHLDTLGRLVRADADVMTEAMIQLHERDGRAWKAEWIALPEAVSFTLAATRYAILLLEGLEADQEQMRANIDARKGFVFAEPVMRALADQVGKHTAHDIIYQAAMRAVEEGWSFEEALMQDPRVADHLSRSDLEGLADIETVMGAGPQLVDRVIEAAG